MEKYRQLKVINTTIRCLPHMCLKYVGYHGETRDPSEVIVAMIKVAYYLKWQQHDREEMYQPIITKKKFGDVTKIYIGKKPVMFLNAEGQCTSCIMSREQILGAINVYYNTNNTTLIPAGTMENLMFYKVESVEPSVKFTDEEKKVMDGKLRSFIERNCKAPGKYSFKKENFKKETGILTSACIGYYLRERHKDSEYAGLHISNVMQNKELVTFEMI